MADAVCGLRDSALTLKTCDRPRVETSMCDSSESMVRSSALDGSLIGSTFLADDVWRSTQAVSCVGRYCIGLRRAHSEGGGGSGLDSGSWRSLSWSITCLAMLRDCSTKPSF